MSEDDIEKRIAEMKAREDEDYRLYPERVRYWQDLGLSRYSAGFIVRAGVYTKEAAANEGAEALIAKIEPLGRKSKSLDELFVILGLSRPLPKWEVVLKMAPTEVLLDELRRRGVIE